MRSISTRLIVAFLSIGIISVAIILITARWNTRAEFIRFLSDQDQTDIVTALSNYHRENGSWAGAERIFFRNRGSQPAGNGADPGRKRPPFILVDEAGKVIIPNERYRIGDQVPKADLTLGIPITEDDQVIGILIPVSVPFEGNPREVEFIDRINRTLLYGALIGAVFALLLGVFLSRTLTRPIRELTQATRAVSEGDLSQQAPSAQMMNWVNSHKPSTR